MELEPLSEYPGLPKSLKRSHPEQKVVSSIFLNLVIKAPQSKQARDGPTQVLMEFVMLWKESSIGN